MSSASNGLGSHFAPSSGDGAPSAGSTDFGTGGGAGSLFGSQRPEDTLMGIYGLSVNPPNGSHAMPSPAPASPASSTARGDTDMFLALAAQGRSANQASLTPAANPIPPAPSSQPAAPGYPGLALHTAPAAPAPSVASVYGTPSAPAGYSAPNPTAAYGTVASTPNTTAFVAATPGAAYGSPSPASVYGAPTHASAAPTAYGSAPAPSVASVYGAASPATTAVYSSGCHAQAAAGTPGGAVRPDGPVNPLAAARRNAASVPAGADTSGLFPIQEVEPAQTKTIDTSFNEGGSRKRTAIIVAIVLVLLVLAAVGAFFGLRYKEAAEARAKIDDAIELLRDTDEIVVPLDAAISSEINTGVASDTLSELMLRSSSTSTTLSSAETLAVEADRSRDVLSDEDVEAIDAVKQSVAARRSMLEIGRMLLSTDTAVNEALNNLAQAYGCISDANTKVQSSVEQFDAYNEALWNGGDTSQFDLWALVQLDNDAVAAITNAQSYVAAAKEAFPDADLSVLENYLSARLTHLSLLAQIDTCIANGDWDGANALNPQYDEAAAAQEAVAQQVPATAAELLTAAYANSTASQREAYSEAREQCVAADSVLNEYLGITDASKEMGVSADGASTQALPAADESAEDAAATADPATDQGATGEPAVDAAAADQAAATEEQAPAAEGEAAA